MKSKPVNISETIHKGKVTFFPLFVNLSTIETTHKQIAPATRAETYLLLPSKAAENFELTAELGLGIL